MNPRDQFVRDIYEVAKSRQPEIYQLPFEDYFKEFPEELKNAEEVGDCMLAKGWTKLEEKNV